MKSKILLAFCSGLGLYLAHSQAVQIWQGGKYIHSMIPTEIDSFQVISNKLYLWKTSVKKDSFDLSQTDSITLGPIFGTLTDSRDSKVYKTVQIGKLNWLAQNLNYGTKVPMVAPSFSNTQIEKYCPANSEDSCAKYGALYPWNEAMNLPTSCNNSNCTLGLNLNHQGACPVGWHIPSKAEWLYLASMIGQNPAYRMRSSLGLGVWNQLTSNDGNSSGFGLVPSGFVWSQAQSSWLGSSLLWDREETAVLGEGHGYYVDATSANLLDNGGDWKETGEAVRCVEDTGVRTPTTGTFTDARDGKSYAFITLGKQIWMAENLAYKPSSGNAWWYNNDSTLNSKYGRLYSWDAAMGQSPSSAANPSQVQGICPQDWHLPSDSEWTQLVTTLGNAGQIATALKSVSWNGTGGNGFNALPGGYNAGGVFYQLGVNAYFWSATESSLGNAWDRNLNTTSTLGRDNNPKTDGFSVRCVYGAAPASSSSTLSSSISSSSSSSSVLSSSVISSSSLISSSSAQISSSSVAISYGSLLDTRDNKTYKTVVIGTQTWMAENLNYLPTTGKTWCYNDSVENCNKLGRLYDWATAMNNQPSSISTPSGIQGVCPTSWHLPSMAEWDTLFNYTAQITGKTTRDSYGGYDSLGTYLKANNPLWTLNYGNDQFGFGALPVGSKSSNGDSVLPGFGYPNKDVFYWSTSTPTPNNAFSPRIVGYSGYVGHGSNWMLSGFAVRCLKD